MTATDPYGNETVLTDQQIAYAKRHCKCDCAGLAIPYLTPWVSLRNILQELMNEAMKEAGAHVFDAEVLADVYDISQEQAQVFLNESGKLDGSQFLHSALRHCIGAGLLARMAGCECSQCLADHREYSQMLYPRPGDEPQSLRLTQAVLYANFLGRTCAGCQGPRGRRTPMRIDGPIESPILVMDLQSKAEIIKCCVGNIKTGAFDIPWTGTEPTTPPEVIGIPDYAKSASTSQ